MKWSLVFVIPWKVGREKSYWETPRDAAFRTGGDIKMDQGIETGGDGRAWSSKGKNSEMEFSENKTTTTNKQSILSWKSNRNNGWDVPILQIRFEHGW